MPGREPSAVAAIRAHVERHDGKERVMVSVAGLKEILAELDALTGFRAIEWNPLRSGTLVRKRDGYSFPGEVRVALTTRGGDVRYVVEATGADYAGMLHIFNPMQIERAVDIDGERVG